MSFDHGAESAHSTEAITSQKDVTPEDIAAGQQRLAQRSADIEAAHSLEARATVDDARKETLAQLIFDKMGEVDPDTGETVVAGVTVPDGHVPERLADLLLQYEQTHQVQIDQHTNIEPILEAVLKAPSIPPEAEAYFEVHCSRPEVVPLAVAKLQALLVDFPNALADPEFAEFELEDCLHQAEREAEIAARTTRISDKQAEIAALDNTERRVDAENAEKREELNEINATNEMLSNEIDAIYREAAAAGGGVDNILSRTREALGNHPELQTPEAKEIAFQKLNQVDAMLADMQAVFTDPVAQAAFADILATSSIDLSADDLTTTFTPILEKVDASDAISDTDKVRLRQIVTGTDVQNTLAETVTDEDGNVTYAHTEKSPKPLRTGVSGYAEPSGRQIIEAKYGDHPPIKKDVTGWSGEEVGLLVEAMHYWHMSQADGTTGFVENVYKVDFSVLDSGGAFDPLSVNRIRQMISHLTVGFAGYDGQIENFEQSRKLLRDQARLLSETQTTFGWENDQSGTLSVVKRLGLQNADGQPNMDVIKSFGDYTQRFYVAGQNQLDLVDYLSKLHPEFVSPVSGAERAQHQLNFDNPNPRDAN